MFLFLQPFPLSMVLALGIFPLPLPVMMLSMPIRLPNMQLGPGSKSESWLFTPPPPCTRSLHKRLCCLQTAWNRPGVMIGTWQRGRVWLFPAVGISGQCLLSMKQLNTRPISGGGTGLKSGLPECSFAALGEVISGNPLEVIRKSHESMPKL